MNHFDEIEGITNKAPVGCRLAICRVDELHPHASYLRHHLTVPASKLSALAERGDLAFHERLAITNTRTILDGYARWTLAGYQGRSTLPCLEYELSEAEALQWILRTHQRSSGLNAFNRVILALDLESSFQEKARLNQQAGGRYKGSSNLTEADRLDVRSEIAGAAGASVGNVSKVKHLLTAANPDLLEALRSGEISIHRAWLWSQETPEEQREALWRHRTENGIRKTIRHLVSRHRSKRAPTQPNFDHVAARLAAMLPSQRNSVKVGVIKSAGKAIYLTEELAMALDLRQLRLCEANKP
ncbi:MAG: hypothetical protein ACXVIO_02980 [Candidatus Angelobacter sp.]